MIHPIAIRSGNPAARVLQAMTILTLGARESGMRCRTTLPSDLGRGGGAGYMDLANDGLMISYHLPRWPTAPQRWELTPAGIEVGRRMLAKELRSGFGRPLDWAGCMLGMVEFVEDEGDKR